MKNFSLWCDFIQRDFIQNEFKNLIKDRVINGATSNPSIFKQAILNSNSYDPKSLKESSSKSRYEKLATIDIKLASEFMLDNYTNNNDGFVSIEVDPELKTTNEIIEEGLRIYNTIKMPNVMIKIPAIEAGYKAMSELLSQGISINATLIFTYEQAKKCLEAFEDGSQRYRANYPLTRLPKGVISIFVSRFDRELEKRLKDSKFYNQVGVMNASRIYKLIESKGLENVRALFASTGVKGDELEKDHYIKELLYPNSINTAPLETIKEFIKQSHDFKEIPSDEEIENFFKELSEFGVNLDEISQKLLEDGLKAFCVAFGEILSELK